MTLVEYFRKHQDKVFRFWYSNVEDDACDFVYVTDVFEDCHGDIAGVMLSWSKERSYSEYFSWDDIKGFALNYEDQEQ